MKYAKGPECPLCVVALLPYTGVGAKTNRRVVEMLPRSRSYCAQETKTTGNLQFEVDAQHCMPLFGSILLFA